MNKHTVADRISFRSSLAPLKVPAFCVLDALTSTSDDPSIQIEALALTLVLLTQPLGLDPHELVSRAKRQISDADAVRNPHLEAIRDFAGGEMK